MLKPLALATLCGLAAFGASQVTKVGNGYDIKVKYAPGKTYNYALNTVVNMAGGPGGGRSQNLNMVLKQKVVGVKNGVATIQASSSGGPGGQTPAQTIKVDSRGKVVGGKSQFNLLNGFPARPLKVGETWKATTDFPMGPGGNGKANVAYTFKGMKNIGGKSVAQIDYRVTMAGAMAMTGSGTSYLAASDGQLVSSTLAGNMKINMGAMGARPQPGQAAPTMNMTLKVNMKRV